MSVCLLLISGCAGLPDNMRRESSFALQDTHNTRSGKANLKRLQKNPDMSGFILLGNGFDAFTARVVLAQVAEKSIDVQYYMIHDDLIGRLFVDQLIKAAERGVRVRLLVDDIDLGGRDEKIAALASIPNIQIRIFNPFTRSGLRVLQLVTGFGEVTRRMHNKSFTVDNQTTIVGGRNIGDEYFEADPALKFGDLDMLAIGPVVNEVSTSFDEYWNDSKSYPIETLYPGIIDKSRIEAGKKELAEFLTHQHVKDYISSLVSSNLAESLRREDMNYYWGKASVLSDHPDKLDSYDTEKEFTLSAQFSPYWQNLENELLIISPYFVPGKEGTKYLKNISKMGVRVRILTNSLASTDVGLVHAGYAKYRIALLKSGVELYELNRLVDSDKIKQKKVAISASKASLHAKSFVFDRKHIFVGSLNLDPRSVTENTEIGIIVTNEEAADLMNEVFDFMVKNRAFRLELQEDDDGFEYIKWHGEDGGEKKVWTFDPYTSIWSRMGLFFMGLLPIESQL